MPGPAPELRAEVRDEAKERADVRDDALVSEDLWVPVRVLVAPHAGVFHGTVTHTPDGPSPVPAGQVIGDVVNLQRATTVVSPVAGDLMGLLAFPGERVRPHQPLAWLRLPPGRAG